MKVVGQSGFSHLSAVRFSPATCGAKIIGTTLQLKPSFSRLTLFNRNIQAVCGTHFYGLLRASLLWHGAVPNPKRREYQNPASFAFLIEVVGPRPNCSRWAICPGAEKPG
jgi:hypothetical protein